MAPPSFRRGTMCPGTRRRWLSVCICAVVVGAAAFQPPAPFFRTTAFSRFDRSPSSRASAAGGSSTYSAPRNSLGLLRRLSRSAKDSEEDESWDSPEDYEAYGRSDKDASSSADARFADSIASSRVRGGNCSLPNGGGEGGGGGGELIAVAPNSACTWLAVSAPSHTRRSRKW